MAEDVKPTGLDYGVIIAFIAPGFVAFHAASYHLPTAQAWTAAASDKEQSVGVFLFVLLASLSMGLAISGLRALVIDKILRLHWLLRRFTVPMASIDWSKVDDKKLPIILAIRDGHYRYYQFYSNTCVALLFWSCSRGLAEGAPLGRAQWAVIFCVLVALFLSAREALKHYADALQQALR